MKTIYLLLLVALFASCSSGSIEEIIPDSPTPVPEQPSVLPNEPYKLKISTEENKENIFHLFSFTLLNEHGKGLDVTLFDLAQVYDSIIWTTSIQSRGLKVFSNKTDDSFTKTKLTMKWSHTFYSPGKYETYLIGYKNNKIIHNDTLRIDVKDEKDFLMYNWHEVKASDKISIGFHNALDKSFMLSAIRKVYDNNPAVKVFLWQTIDNDNDFAQLSDRYLYDYISSIYGQPVYDRDADNLMEKYQELFLHKDTDVVPKAIWLTSKSKIALLRSDREGLIQVFVYAEPLQVH